MIVLSGADLVLPDRVLGPGSLVVAGDRIVDVVSGAMPASPGDMHFDLHGHYVVPGFIDVHVHGIHGIDSLDGPHAVSSIAAQLPRYGVTAFCPTSLACSPSALNRFLLAVKEARLAPTDGSARVLPAHLESNFLNPEYRGAQPVECLRLPPVGSGLDRQHFARSAPPPPLGSGLDRQHFARLAPSDPTPYTGEDILAEIHRAEADIAVVTIAPELQGGLDLIRFLRSRGLLVSLGHSAASFEIGGEAIAAGATQATHLFNRMPKMGHRHPGLAGAVLESEEVVAELVCDGYHVHPAMMRVAIAAKTPARMMAITDGTAGAGLPPGARVALGSQSILVEERASFLDDGTLAGSVLTMDKAFRVLIGQVGLTPVDASIMCSTTPARQLRLDGHGVLTTGAIADIAVLDAQCNVVQTWVGGRLAFSSTPAAS